MPAGQVDARAAVRLSTDVRVCTALNTNAVAKSTSHEASVIKQGQRWNFCDLAHLRNEASRPWEEIACANLQLQLSFGALGVRTTVYRANAAMLIFFWLLPCMKHPVRTPATITKTIATLASGNQKVLVCVEVTDSH